MKTLKQLIKERNLKLKEVAAATGLNIATLSRIQRGHQKPLQYQRKVLEKFFGESFVYISDLEMEHTKRLVAEERVAELEKHNQELWSMYAEAIDKLRRIEDILNIH